MSETAAVIKDVLANIKLDPGLRTSLGDDTNLIEDIDLDSIELLQLMLELEARLSIAIDFERLDMSDLASILRLAALLDTMPAGAAPSR